MLSSWRDTPTRNALVEFVFAVIAERQFGYDDGAEDALKRAAEHDRTVVSTQHDWARVFTGS